VIAGSTIASEPFAVYWIPAPAHMETDGFVSSDQTLDLVDVFKNPH